MITSREDILGKYLKFSGVDTPREIYKAMDEYAKEIAIGFIEYYEKFRREESRWWQRQTREHGMVTWVGQEEKEIYDDFINKKPIKCYILPTDTFWQYDESGRLRHFNPQTNAYT